MVRFVDIMFGICTNRSVFSLAGLKMSMLIEARSQITTRKVVDRRINFN